MTGTSSPTAGTALREGPDRPPPGSRAPLPRLPLPRRTLPAYLTVPAGGLVVVVVTAGALLVPVAAVGAAGLAGLAALFWWRPRTGLLLTVVAALLVTQLGALAGAAGGALDEGMIVVGAAVVTARRLLTTGTLVRFPGTWWFVGFGLAGVASSLLQDVPTTLWLAGGLLLLKAVLVGHTAAQLTWDDTHLTTIVRAGVVVAVVLVVTGVLNVALPGLWTGVVAQTTPEMHGPVAAVVGPFRQPAAYGRIAVILAAATLTYQLVVRSTLRGYVLALALSGLALLTFRVKSFVGLVLATAGVVLRAGRPWVVRLALVALPAVLLAAGPTAWRYVVEDLELYYGSGESARALLTAGGLTLAAEHLPLGAGLGRYGSATAAEHYSPEYVALGFEHVWGLGRAEGWGAYLLDTQWPALLGETGWLGTVCYAAGLLCALAVLLRRVPAETPLTRWLRISGVCCLVLVLLDSVGAAAFSSPPSYALLYLAPGIVAGMRAQARGQAGTPARTPAEVAT
ncbi:hypothetical protein Cfla_0735 [Cellulomonas flavigena DSM 20109]|uniref:O-antigen polymerase n=1 Tax=Cellulomonas flavigena (strain ATCC 482 / DSM 20109 / BCRC 11376 / JCM 18109 / NBRC 3775 / NCIMB 8073 / NRS 134) TaxID=446466 RepID=D5UJC3_CELFN|nr:hypothetical protein [Cellulomonas flavigena]ADG73646.1 hypothetical protein Cfla_0735 [Cellulomonas flavigena DSM 20109]